MHPRHRLSPLLAFNAVTLRQDVTQRCFDIDPNTVRAGADRDLTVTVELENTIDEDRDHVWRIEIEGQGIGFKTTTVPAGQTVTDDQTRTIPAELLPTGGGSVDVVIQQLGGRQQTSRCGSLKVLAAEEEPSVDPRLVGFDGCDIVPREVGPDERFDLRVSLTNANAVDVSVNVVWTVDGSPILELPGRTIPAGTVEHTITGETSPELAQILPGQSVDVFVTIANPDIGISIDANCGSVTVIGGFDEAAVFVPADECTVSPQQVTPPQEVSLSATVVNDNLFSAIAEVWWTWEGRRIASVEVEVDPESRTTARATATIEREGGDQVRARVERASGGLANPSGVTPARPFRRLVP